MLWLNVFTNVWMDLRVVICIVIICSQFQQTSPATHESSYLLIPVIRRLHCSVVTTLHAVYLTDLQMVTYPHRNPSERLVINSRLFVSNSYSLVIFTGRIFLSTWSMWYQLLVCDVIAVRMSREHAHERYETRREMRHLAFFAKHIRSHYTVHWECRLCSAGGCVNAAGGMEIITELQSFNFRDFCMVFV